ncbi:carbohydrate ABC transporter permease [Nocardia sp. NPDC004711]
MNLRLSPSSFKQILVHLCLLGGALLVLSPFVIMVFTAFTAEKYVLDGISFEHLTLDNFRMAWSAQAWPALYANSIVTTGLILIGGLVTSIPAGYLLARRTFRGSGTYLVLVLVCLSIPAQVTALPTYVALAKLSLLDTITSLALPFLGSAFGVFLFRQFILTIPRSRFDAARIDGVGPVAMVWRVVLPSVRPAIYAFAMFSVTSHYNDLFWPSVVLQGPQAATVPIGLTTYVNQDVGNYYGPQMASAILAILPLLVAFALVQRRLTQGVALAQ